MSTARRGLAAALIVVSAVGAAGCGSSSKGSSSASSGSSSSDAGSSSSPSPTPSSASPGSDSQRAALDAYVAAGKSKIPSLMKSFEGIFSAVDIEAVYPGTVRYRYVYARQLDASVIIPSLKKQAPTLQSSCKTAIFPGMTQAGITEGQGVQFVYLNHDKSKLWTYTCTS